MMLKMKSRQVDDVTVLDMDGKLVFGEETAALRDTATSALAAHPNLVLNLAGVTYVDSGGLGALVALHGHARKVGGNVKIASLTRRVADLMQITKLVTVFDVHDSADQAVQSFQRRAAA